MDQTEFLINTGLRAVELHELQKKIRSTQMNLTEGYRAFTERNGLEYQHIERHTPTWDRMMADTKPLYAAVKDAKRQLYNAQRRMENWMGNRPNTGGSV